MRVLIATDAWHPQVNGVVRTLASLARSASGLDAEISFLTPEGFPSVGVPTYPGLRIALPNRREIARRIEAAVPEAIHSRPKARSAGRFAAIAAAASLRSPRPTPRASRNMSRSAP